MPLGTASTQLEVLLFIGLATGGSRVVDTREASIHRRAKGNKFWESPLSPHRSRKEDEQEKSDQILLLLSSV